MRDTPSRGKWHGCARRPNGYIHAQRVRNRGELVVTQLTLGLLLVLGSIGSLFALAPRGGRSSRIAGIPFVEPFVGIVIVALLMLGILLVAAQFSAFDTMSMLRSR
jgi:hypothetical protein